VSGKITAPAVFEAVGRETGRMIRRKAEKQFRNRYSALRKSDAKSGEWVVIGMVSAFFEEGKSADHVPQLVLEVVSVTNPFPSRASVLIGDSKDILLVRLDLEEWPCASLELIMEAKNSLSRIVGLRRSLTVRIPRH
jgi:hypothetical protein